MITVDTLRKLALSFPEVIEAPHFEKTSFRVNKKIFATYDNTKHHACIKLSEIDQDVFSSFDNSVIFPVDNKWGKLGWTIIDLNIVSDDVFTDALMTAYCEVAPKKLADLVR
ncbi:MAG: MmcQ/YjbR family DNA-binding protein [Saprospiraceae bacterium]|nr:MmcQ/YjbR family DNA-binding protein [Saprospiraceae bacterium]